MRSEQSLWGQALSIPQCAIPAAPLDRQPDVRVAARAVDAAAAAVAQAEAALDRAEVRAPRDGVVIEIHARPGERPGDAGVLTLGDIDAMGVEVEVYQAAIGAVAVGAAVMIDADALPQSLSGAVIRIGLQVGRQTLTDASPAANTDARVFKVHVDLSPDSAALARGLSNLQVTARIARTPPKGAS